MKSILITFGLLASTFCFAQSTKNTALNSTASTQTTAANTPPDKSATLLFAAGKADLSAVGKESIKALLSQKMPYYEVSGYADAHGDSLKNVLLSQNRAKTVADFLMAQGVDAKAIIVNYFGASQAKSKNVKNPNDRKVEVLAFSKLLASWKEMEEKPQFFMITNKRDTVLTGKKGTIIKLPANCLSGDPTKPIKMVLKEYYGQYDMILNNMATVSDGKLLESSGMLFLAAEQNGKQLTATKPLSYQFPNQDKNGNTDYNLYKGVKTASGVNWKLTEGSDKKNIFQPHAMKDTIPTVFAVDMTKDGADRIKTTEDLYMSDINGIIAYVGDFDISLSDCNEIARPKDYIHTLAQLDKQIYSNDYTRTAKYTIECVENAAIDTHDIEGLVTKYCNERFPTKFYAALTQKAKFEFHLNGACSIDKYTVSTGNTYSDSALISAIIDWKKTNYFRSAPKFKNKRLTIHLLDKDLACSEARKYFQIMAHHYDSIKTKVRKEMIDVEKNTINSVSKSTADTYFKYASQNIGYINCDRFAGLTNLTNLTINTNTVENKDKPTIHVILKNKKTMIMAYCIKDDNGKFEAPNLPQNEPVYVIALTDKDGKAYMDIQETRVGSAPITMNTTLATPTKLKAMRALLE
jgi:OmpA family